MVSAREMKGYALHARDGAVGRVSGFYFEEEGCDVEHLVAAAGGLLYNRQVLVGVEHLLGADGAGRAVRVDLSADEVIYGPSAVGAPFTTDVAGYQVRLLRGVRLRPAHRRHAFRGGPQGLGSRREGDPPRCRVRAAARGAGR